MIYLISILVLFLIYCISGVLLHFAFALSKNSVVVGIFAAVNKSVWEHIKLLLTPVFVCSFISFMISKDNNFFILLVELISAITLIILFYEIKLLLFKEKNNYLNIISFVAVSFITAFLHYALKGIYISTLANALSFVVVLIIFGMYLTFTIFPLKHRYFKDPITGTYGINSYVNKSV